MKRHALETLVCPFSQSKLSLVSFEETPLDLTAEQVERCRRLQINPVAAGHAVKEGILYSEESGRWFPIVNYTPILLDFPTDMHRQFKDGCFHQVRDG